MNKFKKCLLMGLVGMLIFSPAVMAQSRTATFGDQNSSNVYRMTADSYGVITFASDTGIKYPYESFSSSTVGTNTITASETGKTIVDMCGVTNGVAINQGGSKYTLPTAVVGMEFTLSAGGQCFVTLDVDDMDTILYSSSSTGMHAGDSLKSTGQAGDNVTLFCPATTKWQVKSMFGTWTDNGTL